MYQIIEFIEGKHKGKFAIRYKSIFTKLFCIKVYVDLKDSYKKDHSLLKWTYNSNFFKDCITKDYDYIENIFNMIIKQKEKKKTKEKILKYAKKQ